MKKGLLVILGLILLFTLGLEIYQRNLPSETVDTPQGEVTFVENIQKTEEIPLSAWLALYDSGTFAKLSIEDSVNLNGYQFVSTGGSSSFWTFGAPSEVVNYIVFSAKKPLDVSPTDLGIALTGGIPVETIYNTKSIFVTFFEQIGGLLLLLVLLFFGLKFFLPKGGTGAGGLLSVKVGKQTTKEENKTKFSDIAGMEEVKNELMEIVDYLKNPEKYNKVGARHPKGVLLYGEPGSGKTLLARAVAGEADVPFFSASGSEFMEMLVGMGAAKVRSLFDKAKQADKAIIFIDEIDAVGKKRGNGYTGGHQEQEQTLNQILTEMDGFDNTTKIIVIAATNRPDTLDPALLRAGRFDRKVYVSAPTKEERIQIFEYYLKNKKIASDVKIETLAKRTTGLVGADIENVVNEAALKLAKENRTVLEIDDFEYALEKVIMGPEKKVKHAQEKERKITAYHELGHALLAHLIEEADPVEKISIVRRGQALGVTWTTPQEDKNLYSKKHILAEVTVLFGGRAAEDVFFGKDEITTGASNDFERASAIITNLVTKYGMDEEIGQVVYPQKDTGEYSLYKPYSEKTAEAIDAKIKEYISACYERAKKVLSENRELLDKIASLLLEKEYLTSEEFSSIVENPDNIPELTEKAHQKRLEKEKEEKEREVQAQKKSEEDTVKKQKEQEEKITGVSQSSKKKLFAKKKK